MATKAELKKAELQFELDDTKKELELYKKMMAAQIRGEKPDTTGVYEDHISKFSYEFWRLQAHHGGWVKLNTNIYGTLQLVYVDDLAEMIEDSRIMAHIYEHACRVRGY